MNQIEEIKASVAKRRAWTEDLRLYHGFSMGMHNVYDDSVRESETLLKLLEEKDIKYRNKEVECNNLLCLVNEANIIDVIEENKALKAKLLNLEENEELKIKLYEAKKENIRLKTHLISQEKRNSQCFRQEYIDESRKIQDK